MMRQTALAAAALFAAAAGPTQDPTPAGPDKTVAVYGDWEARCDLHPAAAAPRACELVQGVVDREHRPILTLALKPGATPEAAPVLLVQMPVNVLAAGDMHLGFDAATPSIPVKLQFCVASGCFGSAELPAPLRDRLFAWGDKPAIFTFVSATQTHVQVPVSWRGFPQAYAAMTKPAP